MNSDPNQIWKCNNCELTADNNGYSGYGYTVTGRSHNWAGIYQEITPDNFRPVIDRVKNKFSF